MADSGPAHRRGLSQIDDGDDNASGPHGVCPHATCDPRRARVHPVASRGGLRVARAGQRRRRPTVEMLCTISAICVLEFPGAGADFQRAVSSPDLAAVARSCYAMLPGDKEWPEMCLKKHLAALRASASAFVNDNTEGIKRQGLPPAEHSMANKKFGGPVKAHKTKPEGRNAVNSAGMTPRRRLFDDDHFSTVTPEPSDSLSSEPSFRARSGGLPFGRNQIGQDADDLFDSSRRSTSPDGQIFGVEDDFQLQYLHLERSIAMGKPTAKTSAVCFDFDRTLSEDHVHHMTQASRARLSDEEAVTAFGGPRRIQQLAAFLSELEAAGAAIHIISLGHKSEIMDSLASVGLNQLFPSERIIGCDEIRGLCLVTKAQCTAHVASLYGLRRQDVLLVDDDHDQLLECSEESESALPTTCYSMSSIEDDSTCGTYWVQSGRGLTARDMAAIGGMARSRKMALSQ